MSEFSGFTTSEINRTFRPQEGGFVSRSLGIHGAPLPSPLWTIACVAQNRVTEGAELNMPHITPGYEPQVLREYEERYGYTDVDVSVSAVRAGQLAEIGRQILILNEQGSIQPPLKSSEIQTIGHLVTTVDQTAAH